MIIDQLSNADRYRSLSRGIDAALTFLRTTDLDALQPGKHDLADGLFAIVEKYDTKPASDDSIWETHRKMLDVQYIVAGQERMGWMALDERAQVKTPYDEASDKTFYQPGDDSVVVPAGSFAVFLPEDVHAPGLAVDQSAAVHKVVVKVPLGELA